MPNITRDDLLQAGVNVDNVLVGPSMIYLQSTTNFTNTGYAAAAFPRYIEDVVDVTTGQAMSANGWSAMGYTNTISLGRTRRTVAISSDQAANIDYVHDVWEGEGRTRLMETKFSTLQQLWQANPVGIQAVTGSVITGQQKITFGVPVTIPNSRLAILHPSKLGDIWLFVYARVMLHIQTSPTWGRTAAAEWEMVYTAMPDSRIIAANDRVLQLFKTTAPYLTVS